MSIVWFIVGIPVAIECLAGMLTCRDYLRQPGLRARALEPLVVPTLILGVAFWLAGPTHLDAFVAALVFVVVWQLAVFAIARWLISQGRFSAQSFDTDESP